MTSKSNIASIVSAYNKSVKDGYEGTMEDWLGQLSTVVSQDELAAVSSANRLSEAAGDLGRAIAWDTFDRPDGPVGTSDSGHAWTASRGTWSIADGRAVFTGQTNGHLLMDPGEHDVEVEATLVGQETTSLAFRALNGQNSLRVLLDYRISTDTGNDLPVLRIQKRVDGSDTVLALSDILSAHIGGGDWRVRVRAVGHRIMAWVNGDEMLAHTLSPADFAAFSGTRVGISGGIPDTGSSWDDFIVRSA